MDVRFWHLADISKLAINVRFRGADFDALEHAADTNFSLGNCTDARMCQAPNDRPRQPK